MNEIILPILAALAGGMLGLLYFAGLWWTIQLGVSSKHPGLLFVTSFLLRTGIVLCGFYFIAGSDWKKMVACLLGFILARFIILQRKNPQTAIPATSRATPVKEANHAPES